jgi:hypothetical protein
MDQHTSSQAVAPTESSDDAAVTAETSRVDSRTVHAIQDVLIGTYVVVLMLADGISRETKLRVIESLLKARLEGRERELLNAAHQEAETIPDWDCARCREGNPGTFQICWNCSEPQPADAQQLTAESEIALGVESALSLGVEREPELASNDQSQRRPAAAQPDG